MECPSCGKHTSHFLIHPTTLNLYPPLHLPQPGHGGLRIKLVNPAFFHTPLLHFKQIVWRFRVAHLWITLLYFLWEFGGFFLCKTPVCRICCRCYNLAWLMNEQTKHKHETILTKHVWGLTRVTLHIRALITTVNDFRTAFHTSRLVKEERLRQKEKWPIFFVTVVAKGYFSPQIKPFHCQKQQNYA